MAFSKRPMRRSALIGPWGVGAIVPFPNDEALMIAGLDAWRYNDSKQKMENSMFQQSSIVLTQQYWAWQWKPQ